MRVLYNIALFVVLACTICSCREELCYDHHHGSTVRFFIDCSLRWNLTWNNSWEDYYDHTYDIDWNRVYPNDPEGVRVICYPWNNSINNIIKNFPKGGGEMILPNGIYDCLIYNNDTENIQFFDIGEAEIMSATTRSRTLGTFAYTDNYQYVVNQPDMLFATSVDTLVIEYSNNDNFNPGRDETAKIVEIKETLHPLVYTYVVRFNFESGAEYVNVANGILENMAGSVLLKSGKTLDDMVNLPFEDCVIDTKGVTAYLTSFGLCNFDPSFNDDSGRGWYSREASRSSEGETARGDRPRATGNERNILIVQMALKSGKIKRIEFDVTDQLKMQPRGGLIVVNDIVVTPEEGAGESGKFDINLNDWNEEYESIPMEK